MSAADRIQRNDRGWRMGESHHNAIISDEIVNQLRDLHEQKQVGPVRLQKLFPRLNYRTICSIIYYQRRAFTKPMSQIQHTTGPSDEQLGYEDE